MVALLKEETFARYAAVEAARPKPPTGPRPSSTYPRDVVSFRLDLIGPNPAREAKAASTPAPRPSPTRPGAEAEKPPVVTPALAAATAVVVLLLLSLVRIAQGPPPSNSWDSLVPVSVSEPGAAPGEIVRVVDAGDTLWAIAGEIAPDADRRLVIDALASRNGGSGLMTGQRLVIPADLLAS